ncbi:hypothetical protein BpHYR1_049859 [Brachionus plicatilis]|uniref:Prion-like-(Q N-rich) domain-bearing 25 n=1 Tax=Brachionus plicatilis TaxID=10195 RepID=A0A3M7SU66_BRAPC|nr:hypothetical protein BpHYR1_049859 [Brachionus plicatilis]
MDSSTHFNISEDAIKLQVLNNKKNQVPKWFVVSGLIIFVVSFAFMGVSLGIAITGQPKGLYNQSCSSRSCENQLETNHSTNLLSYDEICGQNDLCKQDEFLICSDSFKCTCSMDRYWDAKMSRCILKKRLNEACDGNECQSTLVCQSQVCKCPNAKMFFFDGKNCQPKLIFNQSCESSDECLDSENTICQNSKFMLSSKLYFETGSIMNLASLRTEDYNFRGLIVILIKLVFKLCGPFSLVTTLNIYLKKKNRNKPHDARCWRDKEKNNLKLIRLRIYKDCNTKLFKAVHNFYIIAVYCNPFRKKHKIFYTLY